MLRPWHSTKLRGRWPPRSILISRPHNTSLHASTVQRRKWFGKEKTEKPSCSSTADLESLFSKDEKVEESNAKDSAANATLSFLFEDDQHDEIKRGDSSQKQTPDVEVRTLNRDEQPKAPIKRLGFVPNFRQALLGKSPPLLHQTIETKEDADKLQLYIWEWNYHELRKSMLERTGDLNALLARLYMLGSQPDHRAYLHGIRIAGVRRKKPLALKMYLNKWMEYDRGTRHKHLPLIWHTTEKVLTDFERQVKESVGFTDRYNAQCLELLTGLTTGDGLNTIRQPSLLNLLDKSNLDHWSKYLHLVYTTGGAAALKREYNDFKIYRRSSKWNTEHNQEFLHCKLPNLFIRAFANPESWQLAWQLAYRLKTSREVEEATWCRLLVYPLGARSWTPEFNEPALKMLEDEISRIEDQMGLRWEGGECGYHFMPEMGKLRAFSKRPKAFVRHKKGTYSRDAGDQIEENLEETSGEEDAPEEEDKLSG